MKRCLFFWISLMSLIQTGCVQSNRLDARFEGASARFDGTTLSISTGSIERRWVLVSDGLATTDVINLARKRTVARRQDPDHADWHIPQLSGPATLVSINADQGDDEGLTARHLRVVTRFRIGEAELMHEVWAFPNAPGLRTQLWLRNLPESFRPVDEPTASKLNIERTAERVPLDPTMSRRRFIGYFNDTQHRNEKEKPLKRDVQSSDASLAPMTNDWSSIAAISSDETGLALVKENHKCVNQAGVDTGQFVATKSDLASTGLGNPRAGTKDFEWTWANWMLVFDGTDAGLQMSLKEFDRLRFPHRPERDEWVKVCTWGSSTTARDGRNYATEREVLPEMDLSARIGADVFLIDDGWQVSLDAKSSTPDGGIGWRPHPANYPAGWAKVIDSAARNGLQLAIWGDVNEISLGDMRWNYEQLSPHLVSMKLDFGVFNSRQKLDSIRHLARDFMKSSKGQVSISWDVTENAPRVGYFWAREFGPVKLTNRKPGAPANVVYIPWLSLRDAWQLSRFQNLNKWQIVVQNPENVDRELSDAHRYGIDYCVATSLMGVPELFCLPRFMTDEARQAVRRILDVYKVERTRIFASTVFPIGAEPSNESWTGFQAVHPDGDGYLMVFREVDNREPEGTLQMVKLRNCALKLTNLLTGTEHTADIGTSGDIHFSLPKPGSFAFYRYQAR